MDTLPDCIEHELSFSFGEISIDMNLNAQGPTVGVSTAGGGDVSVGTGDD